MALDSAEVHRAISLLRKYLEKCALPADLRAELLGITPVVQASEYWRVETHVWWERRSYVLQLHGMNFSVRDVGEVRRVSFRAGEEVLQFETEERTCADRWSLNFPRPEPFSLEKKHHRIDGESLVMTVEFGVHLFTENFGDKDFPTSMLRHLPIHAEFQGVDTVPAMAKRGGSPYREAMRIADRDDIPPRVMETIRTYVREIDIPGYTDRIHGWRTKVHGGRVLRFPYRVRGQSIAAFVLEKDGLVYAPFSDLLVEF